MVVFGLQERYPLNTKKEGWKNIAKEIINVINVKNVSLEEETEVFRMGKYEKEKLRSMKIRLKTQATAEEILTRAWKLSMNDPYN